MLISHKLKAIFIHVPKTGGMSTRTLLKQIPEYEFVEMTNTHHGIHMWRIPDGCEDYFIFGTARNPYDRYFSFYLHAMREQNHPANRRVRPTSNGAGFCTYREFAEFNLGCHLPLQGPCAMMLRKANRVLRFERLQEDFNQLPFLTRSHTLPHINDSRGRPSWQSVTTPRIARLVNRVFQSDFQEYGYQQLHHDPQYGSQTHSRNGQPHVFAELGYLHANPDVSRAVAFGGMRSGEVHWQRFGQRERRGMWLTPRGREFDASGFGRQNPQILYDVQRGQIASVEAHWRRNGIRQGVNPVWRDRRLADVSLIVPMRSERPGAAASLSSVIRNRARSQELIVVDVSDDPLTRREVWCRLAGHPACWLLTARGSMEAAINFGRRYASGTVWVPDVCCGAA